MAVKSFPWQEISQQEAASSKDDPEIIKDDNDEENEEDWGMAQIEIGNRKRKNEDNNNDDFENPSKKKYSFSNRNKLSKKRPSKIKIIKVEQFKILKPGHLDDHSTRSNCYQDTRS